MRNIDRSPAAVSQRLYALEVVKQLKSLTQLVSSRNYTADAVTMTHDDEAGVIRVELVLRIRMLDVEPLP